MSRPLSDADLARFKERVCDVAAALFAERGAENVSMRQIAAALEVSPMTPYRYFASREEILTAVRIRGFETFAARLEAAHADTPGDGTAKAVAMGRAYIGFALANAHTYRLMFGLTQQDDAADGPLGRAVARARATLSVIGDRLIARGIPEAEARATEGLIWSALHGAVGLELAGTMPPGSAQDTLTLLARTLGRAG
ncbi:TetR/AcrR family transcriptional regulator [Erythrobacter sp. BLCC-B19]|uniref:TetR/AcrR family transcriptional regulator n=1 Tax=Erythrobacter sp. BLCC-B19 TaxID=3025315 RepID=UPI002362B340|nr:TetR/AcrR family transcriptional regulator [Erythrobacter sp. BLCC-B19]WDA39795.1 TetR/AcrR family transcriptional regulator [Erythrobacter sp. BLCC-B19]